MISLSMIREHSGIKEGRLNFFNMMCCSSQASGTLSWSLQRAASTVAGWCLKAQVPRDVQKSSPEWIGSLGKLQTSVAGGKFSSDSLSFHLGSTSRLW